MKIEQVLIHYLLKNKQLSLQGIGVFLLESAVAEPSDPNRPISIPEGAITFTHDPRTAEDTALVDFITEYTGKIQPLASADLDSYLMLGRQFLNIGNPMIIPGIGTIEKTNSGELVFKGGAHHAERMESNKAREEEEESMEEAEENMFTDYSSKKKSTTGRKVLLVIGLIILGLMIWAIWNYALNSANEPENITKAIIPPVSLEDSMQDTGNVAPETAAVNPQSAMEDPYTFKAVVNQYNNLQNAQNRYNSLKSYGRQVILYTNDSIIFKIAEPFIRPLSDTAKVRDSLNAYYGPNKTKIEF